MHHDSTRASAIKIALAFLAIYLIWGSTFLATRYAVASIPPFFVAGTRYFLARLILCAVAQWKQQTRITFQQFTTTVGMGALFFVFCHGGLAWAARHVPSGVSALLMSSISLWTAGTVLTKRVSLPGSVLLLLLGTISGQSADLNLSTIKGEAIWAMLFLTFFGSLAGFTCYIWLLRVSTPTRVATYAYVNPIVALLLGWGVGGERPGLLSLVASLIVVASVATVITARNIPSVSKPQSAGFQPRLAADEM